MEIRKTLLPGVLIIQPRIHRDARGYFVETWHKDRYREAGVPEDFAQDNISHSAQGVLRGLHFQSPRSQGKLITVVEGEIFDVAVDIRPGSPTMGKWTGVRLTGEMGTQFWIPAGYAHGFCVVSDSATVSYKCTDTYAPECEGTVLWNDPAIGIEWPQLKEYFVSDKDKKGLSLKDFPKEKLPKFS